MGKRTEIWGAFTAAFCSTLREMPVILAGGLVLSLLSSQSPYGLWGLVPGLAISAAWEITYFVLILLFTWHAGRRNQFLPTSGDSFSITLFKNAVGSYLVSRVVYEVIKITLQLPYFFVGMGEPVILRLYFDIALPFLSTLAMLALVAGMCETLACGRIVTLIGGARMLWRHKYPVIAFAALYTLWVNLRPFSDRLITVIGVECYLSVLDWVSPITMVVEGHRPRPEFMTFLAVFVSNLTRCAFWCLQVMLTGHLVGKSLSPTESPVPISGRMG